MNLPWRSSSAEKNLTTDIGKQRHLRENLASRLENAKAMVVERTAAAQKLVLTGADDASLDAADAEVAKAEKRVVTLTGALAEADQRLAELERKLAEIADQKLRKQVAGQIEAVIVDLSSAGATVIENLTVLAEVAGRAGLVINDGLGLRIFSERVAAELPAALELIDGLLRSHIAAMLSGSAPAMLHAPEPALPPKIAEPETSLIFAVQPLAWTENGLTRVHPKGWEVPLPVSLVQRGMELKAVVPVGHPMAQGMRGKHPRTLPQLSDCTRLDDSVEHQQPVDIDPEQPLRHPKRQREDRVLHSAYVERSAAFLKPAKA